MFEYQVVSIIVNHNYSLIVLSSISIILQSGNLLYKRLIVVCKVDYPEGRIIEIELTTIRL